MSSEQINRVINKWNKLNSVAFNIHKNNGFIDKTKCNYDISHRQFDILLATTFGGLNSVTELAKNMGLSKSTLSLVISKMVNKGYIQRIRDENQKDCRHVGIESTESGKEIIYDFVYNHLTEFESFYNGLTDDGRYYFAKGITNLRQIVGETSGIYATICELIYKNNKERYACFSNEVLEMSKDLIYFVSVFFKSPEVVKIGLDDLCKVSKLTITQLRIMDIILKDNITSIAELEKITKTSVSALSICISRLEKKGFIEKKYDKTLGDGRRMYIFVTSEGKKVLENENKKLNELKHSFLLTLNDVQLNAYEESLDCLMKAFVNI